MLDSIVNKVVEYVITLFLEITRMQFEVGLTKYFVFR